MPSRLSPFDLQVSRFRSTAAQYDRVEITLQIFGRHITTNTNICQKRNSFVRQKLYASLDDALVELHIRYAVHEQAADTVIAFENRHSVAVLVQLVRTGESGWA